MKQEMNENKEKFEYSYSAPTELERREIASIKKQYEVPAIAVGKLAHIRRLDAYVKGSATAFGIASGVIGALIFGLGMSMILEWNLYLWGALVSIIGLVPLALAHPIYKLVLAKNKKKYGAEIIRLSEELLSGDEV